MVHEYKIYLKTRTVAPKKMNKLHVSTALTETRL